MFELLAPAGNERCFFAAINNGADAVYLGLSDFSARKNAANFTKENIAYYISYAHVLGVKVYVAVNTLVKNSEFNDFFSTVEAAYLAGADAFIVQDVFLAKPLKEKFPDIVLHLSTQGGVNNEKGAVYALNHGFSRVILARETELHEIERIARVVETEIFVHGALCSCFSGHCYMSSFIGGNSGNRGLCKQPCRKKYSLESKTEQGDYCISLADLNLADDIARLKSAGVKSVKIEGRMRTPEYVAAAVRLYRRAIDGKSYDLHEIKRTFNRGDYTKGYVFGFNGSILSDKTQSHIGETVGNIAEIRGNRICVNSNEIFRAGDGFKILRNGIEVGNAVCTVNGKILDYKGSVKVGDQVNVTKDGTLAEKLSEPTKLKKITVKATAAEGEKLKLEAEGFTVESEKILEQAKTSALTENEIKDNLLKTDKYPFEIKGEIRIIGKTFLAKSQLNAARSALYAKIFNGSAVKRTSVFNPPRERDFLIPQRNHKRIIVTDKIIKCDADDLQVFFPDNYDEIKDEHYGAYLYVPSFLTERDIDKIISISSNFTGFYVDGLCGLQLAEALKIPFIAGLGLNAFNYFDVAALLSEGAEAIVLSKELSFNEIKDFSPQCCVFTRGNIRLMELLYCPFGKRCAACRRKNTFKLRDELGHEFTVRRYKLNGRCRFEIYNDALLFADSSYSQMINLVCIDDKLRQKVLSGDESLKNTAKTTYGNLKRGVL